MRNVDYVLDRIILVASIAFGIVFMVAMDAVSTHSGAQAVLMILELATMEIFAKTSYQMLQ